MYANYEYREAAEINSAMGRVYEHMHVDQVWKYSPDSLGQ